MLDPADQNLLDGVLHARGEPQRRAVAKAVTLLESTRPDHRVRADALLDALLPHTGRSFRLGISGVPGVGKSTFIEALGLHLIGLQHRVAVLAVDPSSSVSGGSILGDKTRMERLSVERDAFIRPSPTGGTLGGVAAHTREAMLVLEAAGYDIVIVAINKADLDAAAATRAQAQITSSLRLMQRALAPPQQSAHWAPRVLTLSAITGAGLPAFWQAVSEFRALRQSSGRLAERRREQNEAWMWERIEALLHERFRAQPQVAAALPRLTDDVRAGRVAASVAARRLIDAMN